MSSENKLLFFNSDDFGHSHPFNLGVYKGAKSGVLGGTCVLANLEGYREAVELSRDMKNFQFGAHLNIVEGKSLSGVSSLTDFNGNFNNGFVKILQKSYDKSFMRDVEIEFRAQIERLLSDFEITHLNSHVHTHSIPKIFDMVLKLGLEYNIPYVRTQFEKPYYAKPYKPVNLVKLALLNSFSLRNKKACRPEILTNDFLIGVTYTGMMNKKTVLRGLEALRYGLCEILIHPAYYEGEVLRPNNYKEFLITQDETILDEIKALGFKPFVLPQKANLSC